MLAAVDIAELVVHLCSAAGPISSSGSSSGGGSSSSSRGAGLPAQLVSPWMALAARAVKIAVEIQLRLTADISGVAALVCSSTDAQEKEVASCGSMDGTGELELVTGKSSVCSGCRAARLCSSECMKEHLDSHKPVCKRIAAANKAAAAAKQES
ncbi:hypothetical protein OEZ86_005906 [Tetradesmus obliquus]|nr:hypothetical protein OEZ86_005906 [Tetradesmus obliquus]